MNKKFKLFIRHAKDKEALQFFINDMSKKGWQFESMDHYFLYFKRSDEQAYYYVELYDAYAAYAPSKIDEQTEKCNALYEDMGYDFVFKFLMFHVYKSKEDRGAFHSDVEMEKQIIEKSLKKERFFNFYLPVIFTLLVLLVSFTSPTLLLNVLSNNTMLGLLMILFIGFVYSYFTYVKQRQQSTSVDKQVKYIRYRSFCGAIIVCAIVFSVLCFPLLGDGIDATFKYSVTYITTFSLGGCAFWFGMNRFKGVRRVMYGIVIFSLMIVGFLYSQNVLYADHQDELRKSIFSKEVMGLDNAEVHYTNNQSILLKNEVFDVFDEKNYFTYHIVKSNIAFIDEIAFSSLKDEQKMKYAYSYKGCDVYVQEELTPTIDGIEYTYQPMVIIKDDAHVMQVVATTKFDKQRVKQIIQQLDW